MPGVSHLLGGVPRHLIWPYIVKHVVDLQTLIVIIGAHPERARYVESARTVVSGEVIVQRTAILVHELCAVLETEAFALFLFQRDANDGLYRGSITGTRVLNYIDMLDLVGAQTREFLHVQHLAPIDVNLGIATPQHLHTAVVFCLQRRNLRQGVTHGSCFL